jgi:hypothetical protein
MPQSPSPSLTFLRRTDYYTFGKFLSVFTVLVILPSAMSASFVGSRMWVDLYHSSVLSLSPSYKTKQILYRGRGNDTCVGSDKSRIFNTRQTKQSLVNRRSFILKPSILIASILTMNPTESIAACLPGDIRSECIGVYKMPLDDAALQYVETPEQLKKFAPDLQWVSCCFSW